MDAEREQKDFQRRVAAEDIYLALKHGDRLVKKYTVMDFQHFWEDSIIWVKVEGSDEAIKVRVENV